VDLKERLHSEIQKIAGRPVEWRENLIGGPIDSLALVEVVNLVEDLAKEQGRVLNLDRLISEEDLTLEKIHGELTKPEMTK
jgi:hypothetical protein